MKTVDLETAKELEKYLPEGFESYLIYIYWKPEKKLYLEKYDPQNAWYKDDERAVITLAPTLDELLEILPKKIEADGNIYSLILDCHSEIILYESQEQCGSLIELNGTKHYFREVYISTATAAAKLYMWLKDNGHV
jgi:hypothetical protein